MGGARSRGGVCVRAGADAGPARDRTLAHVLGLWPEEYAATAFVQFRALGLTQTAQFFNLLIMGAARDPAQTIEWLLQLDTWQFARYAPLVVETWAGRDPAAALAWALANGVRLSAS